MLWPGLMIAALYASRKLISLAGTGTANDVVFETARPSASLLRKGLHLLKPREDHEGSSEHFDIVASILTQSVRLCRRRFRLTHCIGRGRKSDMFNQA